VARPDTILGWSRKFIKEASNEASNESENKRKSGRPRVHLELESLIVRMARENKSWGYDRIVGALANLGNTVSDKTVGRILKRNGVAPAPQRKKAVTWKEFLQIHKELLIGSNFFSKETESLKLMIVSVLFFIHMTLRELHVA